MNPMLMSSEEIVEKSLVIIQNEANIERKTQLDRIQDIITSEQYMSAIEKMTEDFESKRVSFLGLLENQPGFLQSSFLALHRKLRRKYNWIVCFHDSF